MNALASLLTLLSAQPWIIPVIGVLAASLAFLAGRRWIGARPVPLPEKAVEEPEPVFLSLAAARANQPQPDRRTAPRRRARNRVEVCLSDDTEAVLLLGWVVNCSMGGLCLSVELPLSEGMILKVRPRKAEQTTPWLSIEIRSCRPDGNAWEIGCCFLKPPQWNDLLLFN